jgi:NAD(P)-dependent dehydrogenase (short-subunit alcohol dehydrogenase family)
MSRCAFITGGGRRIGRALALRFAERGWSVAIHFGRSRDDAERTASEARAFGADVGIFQADVRDRDAIRSAVFDAAQQFGTIDLLINNAGVYPRPARIHELDDDAWRSVLETNLYGEFYAAQAAAEVMLRREGDGEAGRIVNLSSLGAFQIWKNRIPYNVSKAAVVQLTRALARSLAPRIMVNSVAPGAIEIPEEPAGGKLLDADRIPLRRYGSVDDIFNAVWFLGVTGTYVTGQTIIVDGGLNIAQETSQE